MLQSVQAGSLSMTMAVPAWYSSFMKPLDAFTLPYLVGNEEKLRPALEGPLGAQINKFAEPAGFKVLGYLLLGARSIVNKQRAINKPEDCKGSSFA
jgi:C4-dicarboxylate-binding protein DctP